MSNEAEIEETVLGVLKTFRPRGPAIRRDQRLITDLKLLSDDATAMALELEHKFRIRIPRPEWGLVLTVQDVIDLFVRHLGGRAAER
jgi:acyl carrier protein